MKKVHARHGGIAMICMLITAVGCNKKGEPSTDKNAALDYQQEMRTFIQDISTWAKQQQPGFLIVPQDGLSLLTSTGDSTGTPVAGYLQAINGVAQEEVYYGYDNQDDVATPAMIRDEYLGLCRVAKANNKRVLVTDYCFTAPKPATSYANNAANGFISYAASHRELDNIATTTPYNVNTRNITSLDSAKNFLYLINTQNYRNKTQFLNALKATNFDVLILDAFFEDASMPLTAADVQSLKTKANGGRRLVLSYMAIGQAEDYRWYWNPQWTTNPPAWLVPAEDPDWEGNYNIRFWMPEWKAIIYGNDASYTKKLLNAGFDGAYLDLYDYEYWLNQ
jgi:cysteinyl-tRNA synthetase